MRILEARTASHCFGVFPFVPDIALDAEDSLACARTRGAGPARSAHRHRAPAVPVECDRLPPAHVGGLDRGAVAADYDFIVLPGTKSTLADLQWLRASGLAEWIVAQHRRGATVIGVCGGFQMLGRSVHDPLGIESDVRFASGLALLPVVTVMAEDEADRGQASQHAGRRPVHGIRNPCRHHRRRGAGRAFCPPRRWRADGACMPGVIGTYLHGALENPDVCAELFGVPAPR